MTSSRTFAFATVALLASASCAGDAYTDPDTSLIDHDDVVRVITALAADEMEGRAAFTPAADRAADFVAAEFAAAGIETVEGAEGYLQRFPVYSVAAGESTVTVNGEQLGPDRVAVRMGAASLSWGTGDAELVVVGPDANPQEVIFGRLRGSGGDAVVLLDPSHAGFLQGRMGQFLVGPTRTLDLAEGSSMVIALAEGTADATYQVEATADITEDHLVNVVGVIPGRRADEIVLFSGHHDHVGIRSGVEGDSIFNGANDDASGTTAVIALAKYYAQRSTPERTIMFAAFAAEEMGGYGSRYFSTQLDPDQVVAMFNIEMIGKPAVEGPNTAWITGFERSSFGEILQQAVTDTDYGFYPDPYPDQNLFYRSDNATLARLGVPAHSISTTPIDVDEDYHQASDEVGTLDLDHMTNTIRAIAMGAEAVINGAATPTRVDSATVN
jgi:hypothetical protein